MCWNGGLHTFSPSFQCGKVHSEELIHVLQCAFYVLLYFHAPSWLLRLWFRAPSGHCSLSLHAEAHPLFLWGLSDLPVSGSLLDGRGSRTETTEASHRMLHLLAFSYRKQLSTILLLFLFLFFFYTFFYSVYISVWPWQYIKHTSVLYYTKQ